jgi:glutamine synthetase
VLAGIRKGLAEKLDPGAETTGNGYEGAEEAAADMPRDWRSASEAAKASAFLRDALGHDLHRTFTAIKESEYLRVARTVSELDYHLYLHEV